MELNETERKAKNNIISSIKSNYLLLRLPKTIYFKVTENKLIVIGNEKIISETIYTNDLFYSICKYCINKKIRFGLIE